MPVITVTKKDLAMNTTLEAQWVTSQITKVEGPTRAKSGKSNNFTVTVALGEDCEAPGKELMTTFNDTRGLGNMYPLFAAVRGVPLSEIHEGDSLDTDELVNAIVDVHVIPTIYEGQKRNEINGWLPEGSGDNQVAF